MVASSSDYSLSGAVGPSTEANEISSASQNLLDIAESQKEQELENTVKENASGADDFACMDYLRMENTLQENAPGTDDFTWMDYLQPGIIYSISGAVGPSTEANEINFASLNLSDVAESQNEQVMENIVKENASGTDDFAWMDYLGMENTVQENASGTDDFTWMDYLQPRTIYSTSGAVGPSTEANEISSDLLNLLDIAESQNEQVMENIVKENAPRADDFAWMDYLGMENTLQENSSGTDDFTWMDCLQPGIIYSTSGVVGPNTKATEISSASLNLLDVAESQNEQVMENIAKENASGPDDFAWMDYLQPGVIYSTSDAVGASTKANEISSASLNLLDVAESQNEQVMENTAKENASGADDFAWMDCLGMGNILQENASGTDDFTWMHYLQPGIIYSIPGAVDQSTEANGIRSASLNLLAVEESQNEQVMKNTVKENASGTDDLTWMDYLQPRTIYSKSGAVGPSTEANEISSASLNLLDVAESQNEQVMVNIVKENASGADDFAWMDYLGMENTLQENASGTDDFTWMDYLLPGIIYSIAGAVGLSIETNEISSASLNLLDVAESQNEQVMENIVKENASEADGFARMDYLRMENTVQENASGTDDFTWMYYLQRGIIYSIEGAVDPSTEANEISSASLNLSDVTESQNELVMENTVKENASGTDDFAWMEWRIHSRKMPLGQMILLGWITFNLESFIQYQAVASITEANEISSASHYLLDVTESQNEQVMENTVKENAYGADDFAWMD